MLTQLHRRIEDELASYARTLDTRYGLSAVSPMLSRRIRDFITRPGKRVRPILCAIAYRGYAHTPARNLYRSALALELLHDFLLIHDDIIDRAALRRGLPSMHAQLAADIRRYRTRKITGEDLAIVVGDMIYAMAVDALDAITEKPARKDAARAAFVRAALDTGAGEFIELMHGMYDIATVDRAAIYRIYDLKTARYTFSSPLTIGAQLAGAPAREQKRLTEYGILVGRAFQLYDDMLDMFGTIAKTGKPLLTDLKESKKTMLLWHAYHRAVGADKRTIRRILGQRRVSIKDLGRVRSIVVASGALATTQADIADLLRRSKKIAASLSMRPVYKSLLTTYIDDLLAA